VRVASKDLIRGRTVVSSRLTRSEDDVKERTTGRVHLNERVVAGEIILK
jgi:hypothetical protein